MANLKRKNEKIKDYIFNLCSLVIFLASVGQIIFNIIKTANSRLLADFSVYYGAIEKFTQGQNPYQYLYNNIPFNYPPSSLIILASLRLLPAKIGEIVLIMLSFLAFWLTFWVVIKLKKVNITWAHFLIILAFFNQTFPVKFTLILGQINLIVLGLSFGALYYYLKSNKRKRDRLISVILFSIAAGLKLFPLYLLPLLVILRDFNYVIAVLGIFLVLNIITGQNLFIHYLWQILPGLSNIGQTPSFYDQSFIALLIRLNIAPTQAKIITVIILLITYGLVLLRSRQRSLLESFVLIFALISIGNFFSWQHHLVFSYPLIFILYLQSIYDKNRSFLTLLAFLILWVIFLFHFPNENFVILRHAFIASYQTMTIIIIIVYALWKKIL